MSCLLLKWHRGGLSSAKGELGGASAVEVSTFLQGYCNQIVICYNKLNNMKAIDLSHVYKKYKGLWVALINDTEVISADKSVRKVVEQAKKKGYEKPLLFKVPKNDLPFVGFT